MKRKSVASRKKRQEIGRPVGKPSVFHVDVGEIFFIEQAHGNNLAVFGYNAKSGKFDRRIAVLNPRDSILVALQNCIGIIAHDAKTGRIAVVHTIHEPASVAEKQAHIEAHQDVKADQQRMEAEVKHFPEYSHIPIRKFLERARALPKTVRNPAYFADDAVRHIAREFGSGSRAHLVGGFSEESTPILFDKLKSALETEGIQVEHNPRHVGGTMPRFLGIRIPDGNMAEIDFGKIKFFVPVSKITAFMQEHKHMNKPAYV